CAANVPEFFTRSDYRGSASGICLVQYVCRIYDIMYLVKLAIAAVWALALRALPRTASMTRKIRGPSTYKGTRQKGRFALEMDAALDSRLDLLRAAQNPDGGRGVVPRKPSLR